MWLGSGVLLTSCSTTATTHGTAWSNFDLMGRPRSIVAADGSSVVKSWDFPQTNPTSFNTDAIEFTTQTVSGQSVTRATTTDILGRPNLVSDPGPVNYGPVTGYTYNVGN